MTWVAADTSGTKIPGFEHGTPVEWNQADGTVKTGVVIIQGTDKVGDVHKILDDADPLGPLVPIAPMFVRRREI